MGENALSSYLGIFYEAKGLGGVQIAVINSVFSIAVVAAALFAGAIGDQISSTRSLLLALSIAMILGTALLYISASYTMILLSVIIYGVGYSPFNGVADQMLMNRLENHPERFGQIRMGGTIGAGVGVVLAGLLMQHGSRFSAHFTSWQADIRRRTRAFSSPLRWWARQSCLLWLQNSRKNSVRTFSLVLRSYCSSSELARSHSLGGSPFT